MGVRIGKAALFSFLAWQAILTAPARGQTAFVIGGGFARDCYVAVKFGAPERFARQTCERALNDEALVPKDLAATHVNRGILALRDRDSAVARSHFDAALNIDPALPQAFLNRAAVNLQLGQWLNAQIDADTALRLGVGPDAWAAHFNKGVALERLGDVAGAYAQFTQASVLAPNQPEPRMELARFTVTTAGAPSG